MASAWGTLKLCTPNPVFGLAPYEEYEVASTYELTEPVHLIGRQAHATKPSLVLPFSVISGQHCLISLHKENGTVVLADKSSNGTAVNGSHVGKGQTKVLQDGDVVTVFEKKDATNPAGPKIDYVFHRAQASRGPLVAALEKQNGELAAELADARKEAERLHGELHELGKREQSAVDEAARLREAGGGGDARAEEAEAAGEKLRARADAAELAVAAAAKRAEDAEARADASDALLADAEAREGSSKAALEASLQEALAKRKEADDALASEKARRVAESNRLAAAEQLVAAHEAEAARRRSEPRVPSADLEGGQGDDDDAPKAKRGPGDALWSALRVRCPAALRVLGSAPPSRRMVMVLAYLAYLQLRVLQLHASPVALEHHAVPAAARPLPGDA